MFKIKNCLDFKKEKIERKKEKSEQGKRKRENRKEKPKRTYCKLAQSAIDGENMGTC
jgi:hypothetical protein